MIEMNWFDKIERYFNEQYYTVEQVKVFVVAKKITELEFKQITGEDYIV